MNSRITASGWVSLALLAGGLLGAGAVTAQDTQAGTEEVVIQAPAKLERQRVSRAVSPAMNVEIVELTRKVSLEDLDLSRSEDVARLEQRIEWLARDSCDRLSDMFPWDASDAAELNRCTQRAIASARAQKERAIASAR